MGPNGGLTSFWWSICELHIPILFLWYLGKDAISRLEMLLRGWGGGGGQRCNPGWRLWVWPIFWPQWVMGLVFWDNWGPGLLVGVGLDKEAETAGHHLLHDESQPENEACTQTREATGAFMTVDQPDWAYMEETLPIFVNFRYGNKTYLLKTTTTTV